MSRLIFRSAGESNSLDTGGAKPTPGGARMALDLCWTVAPAFLSMSSLQLSHWLLDNIYTPLYDVVRARSFSNDLGHARNTFSTGMRSGEHSENKLLSS